MDYSKLSEDEIRKMMGLQLNSPNPTTPAIPLSEKLKIQLDEKKQKAIEDFYNAQEDYKKDKSTSNLNKLRVLRDLYHGSILEEPEEKTMINKFSDLLRPIATAANTTANVIGTGTVEGETNPIGRAGDKVAEYLSSLLTPKKSKFDIVKELSTELPPEFYTTNNPEVKRRLLTEQLRKMNSQATTIDTFGRITNRWGDNKYDPTWLAQQKEQASLSLRAFEQGQKESEAAKRAEMQTAIATGNKDAMKSLQNREYETQLIKEYKADPLVSQARALDETYAQLKNLVKEDSGAGDKLIIDTFAKIGDPAGVVRPNDEAAVRALNGVIGSIKAKIGNVLTGNKLNSEDRQQILDAAYAVVKARKESLDEINKDYISRANEYGSKLFRPYVITEPSPSIIKKAQPATKKITGYMIEGKKYSVDEYESAIKTAPSLKDKATPIKE